VTETPSCVDVLAIKTQNASEGDRVKQGENNIEERERIGRQSTLKEISSWLGGIDNELQLL
jgi:hypothetical protein